MTTPIYVDEAGKSCRLTRPSLFIMSNHYIISTNGIERIRQPRPGVRKEDLLPDPLRPLRGFRIASEPPSFSYCPRLYLCGLHLPWLRHDENSAGTE